MSEPITDGPANFGSLRGITDPSEALRSRRLPRVSSGRRKIPGCPGARAPAESSLITASRVLSTYCRQRCSTCSYWSPYQLQPSYATLLLITELCRRRPSQQHSRNPGGTDLAASCLHTFL